MSLPVVYRRKVGRDLAAGFGYYEDQAVVSRFPYAVFYRVESKRVVVLTVLHTSRDPSTWPQARKAAR